MNPLILQNPSETLENPLLQKHFLQQTLNKCFTDTLRSKKEDHMFFWG